MISSDNERPPAAQMAAASNAALAGVVVAILEELVESKAVDAGRLRLRLESLRTLIHNIDPPAAEIVAFVGAPVGLKPGSN